MIKSTANVKAPDTKRDRELLVKELRRDLQDLLNDPAMLDKLADLVRVLKVAKKPRKRK